jgi:hypothetical protein
MLAVMVLSNHWPSVATLMPKRRDHDQAKGTPRPRLRGPQEKKDENGGDGGVASCFV